MTAFRKFRIGMWAVAILSRIGWACFLFVFAFTKKTIDAHDAYMVMAFMVITCGAPDLVEIISDKETQQ